MFCLVKELALYVVGEGNEHILALENFIPNDHVNRYIFHGYVCLLVIIRDLRSYVLSLTSRILMDELYIFIKFMSVVPITSHLKKRTNFNF